MAAHLRCKITALSADNTVFHRCDTLEGDSGSPIWVDTPNGPLLIAIQSSAPPYQARDDVDNIGVTTLQLPELPAR
jgi:protease YdgD